MYLIISIIFTIAILLIAKQLMVIIEQWCDQPHDINKNSFDPHLYPDNINAFGINAINFIKTGVVKKQLLSNDAPLHNSTKALNHYIDFINRSSMYQYITSIKERKYNGKN